MSNTDAVNALLTAINFDRFHEIEAHHAPAAVFHSFRGPTLRSSVAIADWHRQFLKDYADCNYTDLEYIESGETVVVRATIEAKGYDWRPFTQRVVEVFRIVDGEIVERRSYAMFRDIEFEKPIAAAMDNARGFRGGSSSQTRKTVQDMLNALGSGDMDAGRAAFADKAVMIDGVYGSVAGFDKMVDLVGSIPQPAFGQQRVTSITAGDHVALVEAGFDPARPRKAEWYRLVDGKIMVVEVYWMLREIGVRPDENYANDRHMRKVILPT
ncbi:MAG: nuclear transport factor 2 family protein [Dehalococcoidia bacterium]